MWIKIALREVDPFMLVFFRVLFAAIGLCGYFLFTRRKFSLRYWWVYAFIGFFNVALPFTLISWAENFISSGLAAILNSTVPIFTMLIALVFYREDGFTLSRGIALAVGFLGVLILSYDKLDGNSDFNTLGILAMLAAACGYGASTVFARKADQFVSPEGHSLGQILAALVFMTPAMLVANSPLDLPVKPITWVAFFWLGIVVSFIASVVWFRMIYDIGPSRASMMIYMFPLVGVLLGIIFLDEEVTWQIVVGGSFILASIYLVNAKKISKSQQTNRNYGRKF